MNARNATIGDDEETAILASASHTAPLFDPLGLMSVSTAGLTRSSSVSSSASSTYCSSRQLACEPGYCFVLP